MSPQTITLGKTLSIKLPSIKDVDDDTFALSIMYLDSTGPTSTLPSFMTFDSAKYELKISPTDDNNVGTHKLSLVLTDQNKKPLTRTVPLDIVV